MAQQWVDIKMVRESVSIEQILEYYGLMDQLTHKGEQLIGPCPIHKGSNKSQFHVSLGKSVFHCFGDCKSNVSLHNGGGNLIDFVRVMEGIEEPDDSDQRKAARKAALLIQEWFGLSSPRIPRAQPYTAARETPRPPKPAPEKLAMPVATASDVPQSNPPLKFALQHLDAEYPYLKERGFTPETIAYFGVGYHAGRGIMHGRVAIPIHNADGQLVAYAGRWPGNEPPEGEGKYKLPPFHKSLELFNLHRAKACAREHGLVLVEGCFSVMHLFQHGICHAVALFGSSLSAAQEMHIIETVSSQGRVTLLFDGDPSGRECTKDALERLSRRVFVKAVMLPDSVQPDHLAENDIRSLCS